MEYLNKDWVNLFYYSLEVRKEDTLKVIFKNLINALKSLESNNLFYVDLRPENIMVNVVDYSVKIIDLEDTLEYDDSCSHKHSRERIGIMSYCAPEVVMKVDYDVKMGQVFSLGCLLFSCIEQELLFTDEGATLKGRKTSYVSSSANAKEFINMCTETCPNERIQWSKILDHAWFQ